MSTSNFQLTSPAFTNGDSIPERYTCSGQNVSPPLAVSGVPNGTSALALIMHDPDAPHGDFIHWTVWNINPDIARIPENWIPDDAVEGSNGAGHAQYMGPCPPSGTHRYFIDLYALDAQLDLPPAALEEDVRQALTDHATAKTSLMGTYGIER